MIVNRFTIVVYQLYFTVFAVIAIILGILTKGTRYFAQKKREKPKCLEGWDSRFIQLKNIRLHYVQTGSDDKPLMLFVHGYPEFWYSWRFQLKEFQHDYRCIAIDQRGFNLSDKPPRIEDYNPRELTNDIKNFIEALGYKSAIIVGHDWGGAIAWLFAEYYPEMVEKLICLNITRPATLVNHFRNSYEQFKKSWYFFFYQTPKLPEILSNAEDMKLLEFFFRSKEMGIRNQENFTDEDLEAWKYAYSNNGASFEYPINYYRNAFDPIWLYGEEDILNMPVLVIWGTDDAALGKELAGLSLKKLTNGRAEYVPGASHWVQQDAPEVVNKLMREFLAQQ
ncbi:unnamed protein product [Caenorhabditis bovis]|uniref:AB hydrolase-1 domain-containing protein n=1 Tax=Caenorhabditis bovis TaxID=2654633 RepID=A0A8S1EMA2_9PELO|nr:unnamed protein product [Caenorhabditis bovis]